MKKQILLFLFFAFFSCTSLLAQDLMDLLNTDNPKKTEYAYATFKATRIVNGQSIENPPRGALIFVVSHHFGRLNSGPYEFFGMDQANIRFGFEYGFTDWLSASVGRTSVNKTFDGSLKFKLLRQSSGYRNMPVSVSYFTSMAVNTLHWSDPERKNYFSSRIAYTHQILIARKFSPSISFQLMPTLVHRNLVATRQDQNNIYAVGAGGRVKITKRMAINAEYFYLLPGHTADQLQHSLSFGLDIETGGHVFQLYLTNSQGLIEEQFIAGTTGKWMKGDIHFGFNINRTFQIKKQKIPPAN